MVACKTNAMLQMSLTSDYPLVVRFCVAALHNAGNLSTERDLISLITFPIHMFRSNKWQLNL